MTTARCTRLLGPEALEDRALLSASPTTAALQVPSLTVSATHYSSTDILVQFKQGAKPTSDLSGATVGQQTGLVKGLYEINLSNNVSVSAALAAYQKDPNVILAEKDSYLSVSQVPNDPYFSQQWNLNNTGQTGGTPGADIHAEQAWNVTTGSAPVTVAVMDTGVDYDHPDLYQNIWLNQAEIPQSRLQNLTDVYHDGYISWRDLNNPVNIGPGKIEDYNHDGRIDAADILTPMVLNSQGQDTGMGGWVFSGNTKDGDTAHPNDYFGWNFVDNNNNPYDNNGHGTFVSGEIAAAGNNGVGIAGVDWNAQIMPVQFLGSDGSGTISDFISGLNYAVAHGAKISNNSWQGATNDTLLYQAIQNAQQHGQIFVVAAGNNGINTDNSPQYPANFQVNNVVSVAATDANDQLASFSNYGGNSISLAAPGVNIESTEPEDSYGNLSGTSMSTPLVSGAMALVWSQHPSWSYQQVINQVLSTVDKVSGLSGKVITGGVLDLAAAVGWNLTQRSTPAIVNSYPTGSSGTVTGFVVVFNEAIDSSTFQTGNFTLIRPDGTHVSASSVTPQSNSGDRTFTITVPTQTQGGTYTVQINGVKDLQGNSMQSYQTTFYSAGSSSSGSSGNSGGSSNGTTPAIVNSYPTGSSGTVSGAVVVFNEAVDPSTFQTSNATLTLPDGTQVSPTSITAQAGSGNTTFVIALPTESQSGTYSLRVTGVKDTQGDVMQTYQTTFYNAGQSQSNNGGGNTNSHSTNTFTQSTAVAIPSYGQAVSSLTVNQNVTIGHIQVKLNLQHPQDGNLYIHLVAPDGTYIVLSNRRGGNGQNFTNTVFDSSSSTPIASGSAPFTGTYAPDVSLNYLNGKNASGTWKLWVQDFSGTYTGTLNNWSLVITPKT